MNKKKKAEKSEFHPVSKTADHSLWKLLIDRIRHPWILVVLSVCGSLWLVYADTLRASTLILQEDSVLRLSVLSNVKHIPTIFSEEFLPFTSGQFRPIGYALLSIVRTVVSADHVVFWHLWLLFFHIVNTLLVFALIRRYTTRFFSAWISAMVFALHPVAVQLVNNINAFYILMGLTFSLAAFNGYLAFLNTRKSIYYIFSMIFLLLALGTERAVAGLGFFLLLHEWFYGRDAWKIRLLRLVPFWILPLGFLPLWLKVSPHPLHYLYVELYQGSLWHGLFSFIGGSGKYLEGIFLTRGLMDILHESVQQIYSAWEGQFLIWAGIDGFVLLIALWALWKKMWPVLGVVLACLFLAPYSSVALNRVVEYISWNYFYFPMVGLALFLAGIVDRVQEMHSRILRKSLLFAGMALLCFWGGRAYQLNRYLETPLSYWMQVFSTTEKSPTALYEIGKAYLAEGETGQAIHYFFAPMVKDVKNPCLAMVRYYCRLGDFLASAVHLRFGSRKDKAGLVMEPHCRVGSELLLSSGALDHSEEQLGKLLMVNPYDSEAMARLAQVWSLKGFVNEAYRMLDHIQDFDRGFENADLLRNKIRSWERTLADDPDKLKITPPSQDWLNYVLNQERSPKLRREILALSEKRPYDPMILLEATISALEEKEYDIAVQKIEPAIPSLSGFSYGCAVACRAYALAGQYEKAIEIGMRAIALDNQNTLAWDSLALAQAQKDSLGESNPEFMESLSRMPAIASVYYYNLALQKKKTGLIPEAVNLLEKAIAAKPDYYDALLELGRINVVLRKPESAIELLHKALALKTDDPEVHQYLGRAYLLLKKNEEGLESLRASIKIDPNNAVYHYILGFALDSIQQYEESKREFQRAVELDPDYTQAHFKLANNFYREKKYEEAMLHYQKVVSLDPSFEYVHLNLCSMLYAQKKIDEAIQEAHKEIQNNPRIPESYDVLILLYSEKGDSANVMDMANRAKQLGLSLNRDSLSRIEKLSTISEEATPTPLPTSQ